MGRTPAWQLPLHYRKKPCEKLLFPHWRFWRSHTSALFYNKVRMMCATGYWPNIKHPTTLNEKIVYRNLFGEMRPLFGLVSDKYRVRDYVRDKIGEQYLNELYFVTQRPRDIPFDTLPPKYVIKANHGSGWNIFVDGQTPIDREEIIFKCEGWLQRRYGREAYEPMYRDIEPRILVEKYLEAKDLVVPQDIKFYCFDGKAKFLQYQQGRYRGIKQTWYDANWNPLPIVARMPRLDPIEKPPLFDEMKRLAETLSAEFDFVRMDFYAPDNERIVFGEFTLSPGAGTIEFDPVEWDWTFGAYWNLKQ